jgi:hypothetical protein
MKRAKAKGARIGGLRTKGIELEREARERAEGLRSVFEGLSGLSARKAAEKLTLMACRRQRAASGTRRRLSAFAKD